MLEILTTVTRGGGGGGGHFCLPLFRLARNECSIKTNKPRIPWDSGYIMKNLFGTKVSYLYGVLQVGCQL